MSSESFLGLPINELTAQDFSEQPTFPTTVIIDGQHWQIDTNSKPECIPVSYLKGKGTGGYWLATYMSVGSDGLRKSKKLFWDEAELVKSVEVELTYEEMVAIGENKEHQPEFPQRIWDTHNEVASTLQHVAWDDFQGGAWMGEYRFDGQQTERGSRFTYMTAMRNKIE